MRPPGLGPYQARHRGFDLHAGVCVPADQPDRLERIARYTLRPPVAQDRLQWTDDGQIRLALRRPWSDGTTHLLFDPVELLERLAALTPRPRVNLILYHGVLGARAAWRSLVIQHGTTDETRRTDSAIEAEARAAPRELSVGGPHAPKPGSRCPRLSPLWRATSVDCGDRRFGRGCPHLATPGVRHRGCRNPARPRTPGPRSPTSSSPPIPANSSRLGRQHAGSTSP